VPSTPPWPRRTFLAASTLAALAAATPALAASRPGGTAHRPPSAADDFGGLRKRWLDLQLGSGFDPDAEPYASALKRTGRQAAALLARMKPTDSSLFPGYPFDPPSGITQSYQRLETMAEGCFQPGTGLTGDAELLEALLSGLAHVHERVYNTGTKPYGNWWEWQIGSPRLLLDLVAMLHDRIDAAERAKYLAAIDHFLPESELATYAGHSTGANRVDFCRVYAVRGILGEAPERIATASRALSPVFPYVTEGDGLYADGSFIQHSWVPYSGTYGYVLLDGLGRLFTLLEGTSWEVTDPARHVVFDSVERSYAPLVHDGLVMDSVSGRAVARGTLRLDTKGVQQSDHTRGHQLAAAVVLLSQVANARQSRRWRALVRGWIERDTALPMLDDPQFGVADLARLNAVAEEAGEAAPEPTGHTLFPAMARAVHRRPGWCANIAMASDRVAYYEAGNGENPRGWHTGAGMLYWWGPEETLNHYGDAFWPTVDPYRMPGTTVSAKRLADNAGGEWGEPKPGARWVGGTTDGEFAAVGQHLRGLKSTLNARKSWFCAADAIICLGAGIGCEDGEEVETVFDNRNLGEAGTNALTVDGARQPAALGITGAHHRARWAHLEGHGGWVWPLGAALRVRREERRGAWSDIDEGSATGTLTRRYLTLWTSHGTDPADASYAYLLMPGAGAYELAARAADRHWLAIDANDARAQAVTVRSLGLSAANFWAPCTAGQLTAGAPASVMVRRRALTATVCVAEPARTGEEFELVWHRGVRGVRFADEGIEVLSTRGALRLRVAPGTAGATLRCEVALG
jgi:hyaluronate lyase